MSELSQEDGRLFTVPMIVAGLGSTALFAVASFLAKPRGHNLFRWHAGEIMEDLDPIEWARFPVPLPVPASQEENHGHQANHQPQSLGELLEQHLLAINGLRSAISTLVAAAPNGRDYQPPTDTFRRVQIDHARPARTARKRDGRTGAVRRIYFGSVRHAALTNVMSARIGKMAECAVNRGTHQTISGFGRSGDAVGEGKIRRQRIPSDGVISRSASMRELDGADHKDYRTRAH